MAIINCQKGTEKENSDLSKRDLDCLYFQKLEVGKLCLKKDQIVNIFDFAGHLTSVFTIQLFPTAQLCPLSVKTARENM
jgi:hypothetical protein